MNDERYVRVLMLTVACGALGSYINRLRGTSHWRPSWLPGHSRIYASLFVAILGWVVSTWLVGLAVGLGYYVWSVLPWGHWIDVDQDDYDVDRKRSSYERVIDRISFGSDVVALFWRHLAVFPAMVATPVAYFISHDGKRWADVTADWSDLLLLSTGMTLGWAVLASLCYAVAKRISPEAGRNVGLAERMVGVLWGMTIALFQTWFTR